MPDVLGYLRLLSLPVPEHMRRAADTFRYNRRVFIAPPWQEIFRQDRERKQEFDEAVRTYDAMVATYTEFGYDLIEIPRVPVEERVRFILQSVDPDARPLRARLRFIPVAPIRRYSVRGRRVAFTKFAGASRIEGPARLGR